MIWLDPRLHRDVRERGMESLLSCEVADEDRGGFLQGEHNIFAEQYVGWENAFGDAGDHCAGK